MPEDRAVRIICPHCGNPIQLVEPVVGEVQCLSCGSSFKLDPSATTHHTESDVPARIGRFEVLARLGRGAFGSVYKARDPDLDRLVAVKVPRAGTFATADEQARFVREAKSAARLAHPGIVAVYEVAADTDPPLIVSEFVDGVTLADRLTAGRLSARESAELVAALADALDYAHRAGVVHRDVKPSNVLLTAAGTPKLTDFGLARRDDVAEITVTRDGEVLGTPAYMAPEQAAGRAGVDGRADGYSLGVILYELLTGELPFRGNTRMLLHQVLHDDPKPPRRVNDTIPRDLETITLKALAKSPAKRYATAGDLAADMRRWLEGKPILARPVGRVERAAKWVRRNKAVAGLLAAVVAVLSVGVAATTYFAVTWKRTADELQAELLRAERRDGELSVVKGTVLCERGEEKAGLLWLASGLRGLENTNAPEEAIWHARMSLSLWGQHVAPRVVPLPATDIHRTQGFSDDLKSVFLVEKVSPEDVAVRRYDVNSGRLLVTYAGLRLLPGGEGLISLSECVTTGQSLATYDYGPAHDLPRRVKLWESNTGRLLRTIDLSNRLAKSIGEKSKFSPG